MHDVWISGKTATKGFEYMDFLKNYQKKFYVKTYNQK